MFNKMMMFSETIFGTMSEPSWIPSQIVRANEMSSVEADTVTATTSLDYENVTLLDKCYQVQHEETYTSVIINLIKIAKKSRLASL